MMLDSSGDVRVDETNTWKGRRDDLVARMTPIAKVIW